MTQRDICFRLMASPAYKGFVARKYGPWRGIRRQSQMWWKMESRRFVKWLELSARRDKWRKR